MVFFSCSCPCFFVGFNLLNSSALGSSYTMTKRDSLLAGFTYPSSPMSMPRRHSWRSRGHGHPSSTAAPSDSLTPSRSDTDPTAPNAGPSFPPAGPGDYTSHYGYSTADLATPIPVPADHQTPILPRLAEETHSRENWQKFVVNSTPTTLSRFNRLMTTTPSRHFADLW